jgi:hypothetical protein
MSASVASSRKRINPEPAATGHRAALRVRRASTIKPGSKLPTAAAPPRRVAGKLRVRLGAWLFERGLEREERNYRTMLLTAACCAIWLLIAGTIELTS